MNNQDDIQKETKAVLIAGVATIAVMWIAFSFVRIIFNLLIP